MNHGKVWSLMDSINRNTAKIKEEDKEFLNDIDNRTCSGSDHAAETDVTKEEYARLTSIADSFIK